MNADGDLDNLQVIPSAESHFSWMRTRMSTDRTLEAWMRTAVSLIGFGFTIVQFFARINEIEGVVPARNPNLPRYMGLTLIGLGTLALLMALWQYRLTLRHLHRPQFRPLFGVEGLPGRSPTLAAAMALCLIGIVAFAVILFRMVIH